MLYFPVHRMFRKLLLIPLFALHVGCAGTEFTSNAGADGLPEYHGTVRVLDKMPAGRFIRVGVVKAVGGIITREATLLNNLKEQAARHGANVIVLQAPPRERQTHQGKEVYQAAFAIRVEQ